MRLACPQEGCRARFEVSEEDPDSTLDDVGRHLAREPHWLDYSATVAALARVQEAP